MRKPSEFCIAFFQKELAFSLDHVCLIPSAHPPITLESWNLKTQHNAAIDTRGSTQITITPPAFDSLAAATAFFVNFVHTPTPP